MKNLPSKIATIGICILALASTAATMVTPASAADSNSRDCKISGICSPSDPNFHGNVRSRPVLEDFSNLFGAAPGTEAAAGSQADWNSHDCRHYGICPWSAPVDQTR